MKNKIKNKGAMGPWPSMIGGVIITAIIIYIIVFITSGGLAQSRSYLNLLSYTDFKGFIIESWSEGSSVASDFKMVGVEGEVWAFVFLDSDASRELFKLPTCTSGQTTGSCITSAAKSKINKCTRSVNDLCFCLARFNTGKKSVYNVASVPLGAGYEETFENIKSWNRVMLYNLPDYPVDVAECSLMMGEMRTISNFNTPIFIVTQQGVDTDILVWIATDNSKSIDFEVLTATRPVGWDATFVNVTGLGTSRTGISAPWK